MYNQDKPIYIYIYDVYTATLTSELIHTSKQFLQLFFFFSHTHQFLHFPMCIVSMHLPCIYFCPRYLQQLRIIIIQFIIISFNLLQRLR